jgi:endosialidase-like protein
MRLTSAMSSLGLVILFSSAIAAQSPQSVSQSVPRVINVTGVFRPADGLSAGATETVTLSIYSEPEGGVPLWQETQTVTVDAQGRYSTLLGATSPDGIPAAVFNSEAAHWLGRVFARAGEVEGPRTRLISVPYALRAADADTLGGRPASSYVLAPSAGEPGAAQQTRDTPASPNVIVAGTAGYLAKYSSSVDISNSALFESNGRFGIGTVVPLDFVHVSFTNTNGAVTGLAVQNLGNTATSYSGMLFFDQLGALGQFQGFNNVTHEYRINNIARVAPAGAFNGSINFMLGSTSKFLIASNGNIGIGTATPSALLEVSNAIPGGPANMWMTSYTNAVGPYYMSRRARGTAGAPTAVQSGDGLGGFFGEGYGATAFGPGFAGGLGVMAAQNWTDTAHGTALTFSNTPINATAPLTRMILDASGNLGIGTTSTPAAGILEVSNATSVLPFGQATVSTFGSNGSGSLFVASKARGTSVAPTAVQGGDVLGGFLGRGYGATAFSGTRGGMFVAAAENWTDAAQGTRLNFNTTATGSILPATRMMITPSGDVSIGKNNPDAALGIARNGNAGVAVDAYGTDVLAAVVTRTSRGTQAAPAAVHAADLLGVYAVSGEDGTGILDDFQAGMIGYAAENWAPTARGAGLGFFTTPTGLAENPSDAPSMVILPSGDVGIGTGFDVNGLPTVTDKLQVVGDIRVGTSTTNGCVKRFDGTPLAGTCASDRRFKKDIAPFGSVLNQLTALQPVHYFWRAEDFPTRHFGNTRSYGLIAQDVEQVLPELVAVDGDGYKAVDYSELPLLTIQAVKELKTENDALKQRMVEVDSLKQRVAELERMIADLLATPRR